jgi:hypothetical protein
VFFADLEQGPRDPSNHLLQKPRSHQPDPDHVVSRLPQIPTGIGGHGKANDLRLQQGPDSGLPGISTRSLKDPEVMLADEAHHRRLHGLHIQPTMDPPGLIPPLRKVGWPLQEEVAVLLFQGGFLRMKGLIHAHRLHDSDVPRQK